MQQDGTWRFAAAEGLNGFNRRTSGFNRRTRRFRAVTAPASEWTRAAMNFGAGIPRLIGAIARLVRQSSGCTRGEGSRSGSALHQPALAVEGNNIVSGLNHVDETPAIGVREQVEPWDRGGDGNHFRMAAGYVGVVTERVMAAAWGGRLAPRTLRDDAMEILTVGAAAGLRIDDIGAVVDLPDRYRSPRRMWLWWGYCHRHPPVNFDRAGNRS